MRNLIAIVTAGLLIGAFSLSSITYAQVDIDVGADAEVGGSVEATTPLNTEDDSADAEVDGSAGADVSSDSAVSFSLSKDEAAVASIDAESAELSAGAVVTSEDLTRFATSHMKRDAHIENIEASNDSVSVEYRRKARFLGFIPASIKATAEVTSNGSVEIDYPWYRFLFSVDGTTDNELQARIQEILASTDLSAGLNAHAAAQIMSALTESFQGSVVAEAQMNTGANAAY